MTVSYITDLEEMHTKFGVNEKVRSFDKEKLKTFLKFRVDFLNEELEELKTATNADDVVDALIDLIVVAQGTLDAFDVDSVKAWKAVHDANMAKEVGVKPERPNPLGLPDLIKPAGWTAPSHKDNVGLFAKIFDDVDSSNS